MPRRVQLTPSAVAELQRTAGNSAVLSVLQREQKQTTGVDFVHDWSRSVLEQLPEKKRKQFEGIRWGRYDYPGTVFTKTKPEDIAWCRAQADLVEIEPDKDGNPRFKGTQQDLAQALFNAVNASRPGGGERRVSAGDDAVMTEGTFARHRKQLYDYVQSQLKPLPGQTGFQLNELAGTSFVAMRAAARADGIPLVVNSAWRSLEHDEGMTAQVGNAMAFAGIPHVTGFSVDLDLHVSAKDPATFKEDNLLDFREVVGMYESPVYKWVYEHGAEFGFFAYRDEPWHWEYNPAGFRDAFFAAAPGLKDLR